MAKELTKKQKGWAIAGGVIGTLLIIVIIVALVLLVPLNGKKYEYNWDSSQAFELEKDTYVMQKDANRDFRIVQLTDTQLWSGSKDNKRALEVAAEVLEKANAEGQIDLVVMTGDNVSSLFANYLIKDVIDFMEEQATKYGFLWAPVFGNHDNEVKISPNWSGDQYLKASVDNGGHCLFRKGPTNIGDERGDVLGNYVVTVKEGDEIVQSLYMLDNSTYTEYTEEERNASGGRRSKERPITKQQIEWYKWNQSNINRIAGKTVPNMIFAHFAPYEAGVAFDSYFTGADGKLNDPSEGPVDDIINNDETDEINYGKYYMEPGTVVEVTDDNGEKVLLEGIVGGYGYRPGTAIVDDGFADVARAHGMVGYFFGHDHESDGVIKYNGVIYGYGLKTGPSPKPWNGAREFGGTLITFGEDSADLSVRHIVIQKASDWWK